MTEGVQLKPLDPCPFCEGEATITKHFKEDLWRLTHHCPVVGFISIGWASVASGLVKRWNTRK